METSTPPPSDRQLTRSRDDRLLGGVAGGLATFLGMDVTLVRMAFVVLAVFGGSGVVLYLAMWLLVPPADDSDRPVDANVRAGVGEIRDAARGLADDVRTGWRRDAEHEPADSGPADDTDGATAGAAVDDETATADA